MFNNFNNTVKLNTANDIPIRSTNSSIDKKTCSKQIKFEKKLSFESDTDFQTFLLPLEKDFTKSSKGYASLLSSISNEKIKSVDCKNESEKFKMNELSNNFSETDSLRNNSSSKLFYKYSSYSSDYKYTGSYNNLYYQKCAQLIHDTLENNDSDQTGKSKPLKSQMRIIHSNLQNSHTTKDHVSEGQENVYTEKCIKTICNFSVKLSNSDKLNDKSGDDDDSSESSEIDNFYSGCNNSEKFVDDSSSDESIIFSEEFVKSKYWCSSAGIEQTFVTAVDSESSDDDFLENPIPMALERNVYGSIIAFGSEGYVNASFEDDFLTEKSSIIQSVNKSWDDLMKNVSGEPHESERVSFVPLPNLVSVFQYEPDDDDYCYSLYVLDQLRFRSRIDEFEHLIAPYLTPEYRASIYQRNYIQD